MEQICRECGEQYEVDTRLNDGFCVDCREEVNSEAFQHQDALKAYSAPTAVEPPD